MFSIGKVVWYNVIKTLHSSLIKYKRTNNHYHKIICDKINNMWMWMNLTELVNWNVSRLDVFSRGFVICSLKDFVVSVILFLKNIWKFHLTKRYQPNNYFHWSHFLTFANTEWGTKIYHLIVSQQVMRCCSFGTCQNF